MEALGLITGLLCATCIGLLIRNSMLAENNKHLRKTVALVTEKEFQTNLRPYELVIYYMLLANKYNSQVFHWKQLARHTYYSFRNQSYREQHKEILMEDYINTLVNSDVVSPIIKMEFTYIPLDKIKQDEESLKKAYEIARTNI